LEKLLYEVVKKGSDDVQNSIIKLYFVLTYYKNPAPHDQVV